MYNPQKPWESEHAGYFGSKDKDKRYHKDDKEGYNAGGSPNSDYMRNKETKDKEEEKKDPFEEAEEKKDEKLTDDEIPFRAARQVFNENKQEQREHKEQKKKSLNSIEEAIKKAVEDEKKTIILD